MFNGAFQCAVQRFARARARGQSTNARALRAPKHGERVVRAFVFCTRACDVASRVWEHLYAAISNVEQ
eukprot:4978031-Lingulodinium_polyedra.AAC.1